MVSPLLLEQMLISYYSEEPYSELLCRARYETKVAKEARQWLKDNDLMDDEDGKATERGRVWVEAILATPLPVQTWSMPLPSPPVQEEE